MRSSRAELTAPGSELRAVRLFTLGIGIAATVAVLATVAEVAQPAVHALPGVLLDVQFALFLAAAITGALSATMSLRLLRLVNGALVVLHLLVMLVACFLVVSADPPLPGRQLSWMLIVIAVPVLSALIAWGPVGGWCTLSAFVVLVAVMRLTVGGFTPNAVTNDVHTFSTAMELCVLGAFVLTAAQQADAAAAQARLAGIRAAVAAARHDVQVRAQAILHDEVLAALGFAARASETMIAPLAAQARRAIELVRDLPAVRADGADASPQRVAGELRALAADYGADYAESGEPSSAPIPGAVVDALTGAAQQALVNSRTHAPGSRASVELTWAPGRLQVRIRDDGPGFDVVQASARRMGIRVSILTRMRALPGGDAVVASEPGTGTEVRLEWQPAASAGSLAEAARAVDPPLRDGAVRALCLALVIGQAFLAGYDVWRSGEVLRPAVAGFTVLAALVVATWWPASRPRVQAGVLLILGVTGVSTIAWQDLAAGPSYADYWPLTGHALALGLLCLRGRQRTAVPLAVADFVALCLFLVPGPFGQLAAGTVRALSIVLISAVLAGGLLRLRRRAGESQRRVLELTTAKARQLAERDAANASARTLQDLVGGMLERIGEGRDLTPDEAAECRVLEGRLRDEYRGGRLAREPVVSAVADARRRGVDVVLIDDAPEREMGAERLDAALGWLADSVRRAERSFLARMLPPGRRADVSAAVDGRATDFGG